MRSPFPALVFCGTNRITPSFVRDSESWEEFTEETIASYMEEGTETLIRSLKAFTGPASRYSSLKAKELRFMLEALLEIKEVFAADPLLYRE